MEGKQEKRDNYMQTSIYLYPGADPEIFERGGPEAIIYKILERVGPKSLKLAFECLFQSFSYKFFANIPPKGGETLGPSHKSATVYHIETSDGSSFVLCGSPVFPHQSWKEFKRKDTITCRLI